MSHPDCDPGPDAPAPRPVHGVNLSPAQKVMQECCRAGLSPCRSPFGKIGEARFRVFEARLYSAVKVEKTLFQQGEETLKCCVKILNEWMNEGSEFDEREVRAAFHYMVWRGEVRVEGNHVELLSLE